MLTCPTIEFAYNVHLLLKRINSNRARKQKINESKKGGKGEDILNNK